MTIDSAMSAACPPSALLVFTVVNQLDFERNHRPPIGAKRLPVRKDGHPVTAPRQWRRPSPSCCTAAPCLVTAPTRGQVARGRGSSADYGKAAREPGRACQAAIPPSVKADTPVGPSRAITGCEQSQQISPYSINSSALGENGWRQAKAEHLRGHGVPSLIPAILSATPC